MQSEALCLLLTCLLYTASCLDLLQHAYNAFIT